jgi:hypothetical protein
MAAARPLLRRGSFTGSGTESAAAAEAGVSETLAPLPGAGVVASPVSDLVISLSLFNFMFFPKAICFAQCIVKLDGNYIIIILPDW